MEPAVDEAVALTVTVVPETIDPLKGAVIVAVTGEAPPPGPRGRGAGEEAHALGPGVQPGRICVLVGERCPVRKLRAWVPLLVPGTGAHAVHVPPLNFVNWIELAASVAMANSQTLVPSVAPNRPPPDLNETPLKFGGAVSADHGFAAALYVAPSTSGPLALGRRRKAVG